MQLLEKPTRETKPVCVRIPARDLERLKKMARRLSVHWGKDVRCSELIRNAVSRMYPEEEDAADGGRA